MLELSHRKNRKFGPKSSAGLVEDIEIKFKCMSGFTTEHGKFIMPLQEKLSYGDSSDHCSSFGFTKHFYALIRGTFIYAID